MLASLAEARREIDRLARGHDEYNRANQLLMAENDALRETALTQEEAAALREGPYSSARSSITAHNNAVAKLSRISAGTPTEDRENG